MLRTKENILQYCCTTARSTLRTNRHVLWSLEALRSSSLWPVFQLLLNFLGILPDLSDNPVGDAELCRHSTWFHFLPRCSRTSIFVLRVKFERFWPPADFLEGAPALPDLALDFEPALDELRGVVRFRCAAPFPLPAGCCAAGRHFRSQIRWHSLLLSGSCTPHMP